MLTVKLILERLDKDHRVLERREQPSKSFVRNFISLLYCAHAQIQSGAPYTITDIDGSARTVDSQSISGARYSKGNLMIGAPPGISAARCLPGSDAASVVTLMNRWEIEGSKMGIQVGTGVTAVTPTDTALATRILHGRAAGQLEYGGCELVGIAFVNPNGEFTIRRYFTNLSGGSITVNEAGIHSAGTDYNDYYAWAFLIARDIVSPGVAVANTELLRVSYVPQITV